MVINRKTTIYFTSIAFIINYQEVCSIRKETVFKLTIGKEETEIIMKAAETYIRCENGVYPEGSEDFFLRIYFLKESELSVLKAQQYSERVMDYKKERTQSIISGIRVLQFLLLSSKLCLI